MKSVLAIFSSLNGNQGNSSKLANEYLDKIESNGAVNVQRVDVASLALPHLTGEEMQAWMTDAAQRTDAQHALAKYSDEIIEAIKHADEIVLAVPMYNFGIPSSLKAYFDRVARAGITFKYTETGPVGLLENKTAVVFAARGGVYAGSDYDTQTPYLKHFLNFIGISEVKFVYAEGLNMGEEQAQSAFASASEKIIELSEETRH
ncbi:NAD(P)H-dependent oxidoreductase [Alteromonas sp. D210916BOD_24]|uniref:FMN-dependent NADH-azoreductase n=1 Tax=Alteromonas sp. D210916BOD_24 TaxID=3157618 RepID=UPI00399D3C16